MTENSAVLSECGTYRYRLDRYVGAGDLVVAFVGVNPSTADATIDDATVRKWRGFASRMGASRFIVGNVFAHRATDVKELASVSDLFGPDWLVHMDAIIDQADVIIPCWGSRGKLPQRLRWHLDEMQKALRASGKPLYCWGITTSGDPMHPLMLGYDTPLIPY